VERFVEDAYGLWLGGTEVSTGLLLAHRLRVMCFITGVYIKSVFAGCFGDVLHKIWQDSNFD
jgi:hypothetical protein